jgi:hypothetical protein
MTAQGTQLAACQRMGAGRSVLEPADVQGGCFEVDLVPAQVDNFPRPQPVPKGQKHHQSIAVPIAIGLGR